MSSLTSDLARLANNANVLVSAITTNSSAITSINVGGVAINSSGLGGGPVTFSNDVTISGNLTVSGTTVTVNTQTLDVKDLNITIAKGAGSAAASNGAGITVDSANAQIYYSSNSWNTNLGLNVIGNLGVGINNPTSGLLVQQEGTNITDGSYFLVTSNNSSFGGGATFAGIKAPTVDGASMNILKIQNATGTKFLIDGSGNIGIGTSNPVGILDIWNVGSGRAIRTNPSDYGYILSSYNSSAQNEEQFVIKHNLGVVEIRNERNNINIIANGNIGISNSSPSHKLSVNGNSYLGGNVTVTGTVFYSNNLLLQGDGTNAYIRPINSGGNLFLGSNNSNHIFIGANGNVGVGSFTPIYKLDVNGSIRSFGTLDVNSGSSETNIALNNSNSYVYIFNTTGRSFGFFDGIDGQHRMFYDYSAHTWRTYTQGNERSTANNTHFKYNGIGYFTASPMQIGDGSSAGEIVLNSASGNKYSDVDFAHAGVNKWRIGTNGGDSLVFFRHGVGNYFIMDTSGGVTFVGTTFSYNSKPNFGTGVNYYTDRSLNSGGISSFQGYNGGSNRPTTYDTAIESITGGSGFQIVADWISTTTTPLYVRSLRDCCQNWSSWSTISLAASSDRRRKTNIETINNFKDIIFSLNGVKYDPVNADGTLGNPDPEEPDNRVARPKEFGYIAQDAIEAVPEIVTYNKNLDTPNDLGWASAYTIDYERLVPVLTESIKDLYNQIETLKTEIQTLKGINNV